MQSVDSTAILAVTKQEAISVLMMTVTKTTKPMILYKVSCCTIYEKWFIWCFSISWIMHNKK